MSKPTIDEMLYWVDRFEINAKERGLAVDDYDLANVEAIRAILEQHRKPFAEPTMKEAMGHMKAIKLEAVRDFVQRVEKRIEHEQPYQEVDYSRNAMHAELAAMEIDGQ